jgi:thiol:disulfide interchange protein DsbD
MRQLNACAITALLLAAHAAVAAGGAGDDLLDADVAFRSSARLLKPGLIEVRYDIAPGYYLYRDRLAFSIAPAAHALGKPKLPPGKVKHDEFFGNSVIYRNRAVVTIPLASGGQPVTLTADLQGCADIGVCYPPVRRTFALQSVRPSPDK